MAEKRDYYDVLGVSKDATQKPFSSCRWSERIPQGG